MRLFSLLFILFMGLSVQGKTIDQIKTDIIAVAKQNTAQTDNRPEVRAKLEALLQELIKLSAPVDETTWTRFAPGSWQQIWSDEADNSPAGAPAADLTKVFQVVNTDGRAVNFGERVLPNGQRVTFALEAIGSVKGAVQNTKILAAFFRGQGLQAGESLRWLADDVLDNKLQVFQAVNAGTFPKGPINAQSDLTLYFIDEHLKIGTAPNVYTGISEMFVLERVEQVP